VIPIPIVTFFERVAHKETPGPNRLLGKLVPKISIISACFCTVRRENVQVGMLFASLLIIV